MNKLLAITPFALTVINFSAHAKDMTAFGLTMSDANQQQIEETLNKANAQYSSNYGYKGYSDLPMIKVERYSGFDKLGNVNSAWLNFTKDKKLYQVNVSYSDAGALYNRLKPALDDKYGTPKRRGGGFNQTYTYTHNGYEIELERNTFGFGSDQKTSISYTYMTGEQSANETKRFIDDYIQKQNNKALENDI